MTVLMNWINSAEIEEVKSTVMYAKCKRSAVTMVTTAVPRLLRLKSRGYR